MTEKGKKKGKVLPLLGQRSKKTRYTELRFGIETKVHMSCQKPKWGKRVPRELSHDGGEKKKGVHGGVESPFFCTAVFFFWERMGEKREGEGALFCG